MPNNVVKSLADKSGKSASEVEDKWEEAKKIAHEEYPDLSEDDDKFWKIVTGITKKMLGIKEEKENIRRKIARLLNEQGTTTGDIAVFKKRLSNGENAVYKRHKGHVKGKKFVLTLPDGKEKTFDSLESMINKIKEVTESNEQEMDDWYGVQPDDWHSDGCPVFQVDGSDYESLLSKPTETSYNLNDERIPKGIRNAGYKAGLSFWLQRKDDTNRKYKYVKPRSKKRQKDNDD